MNDDESDWREVSAEEYQTRDGQGTAAMTDDGTCRYWVRVR